ncbi:major facilitator superfamily domain-containing protein [Mycena maculata]|uniref:Major facilitator superfamily domain-containing protein n=1 Tax=Mycena maculata TaxID=230809 RepID=A0AAD7KCV1_9AGAR|nr:major facilitator superfamily domain-containing protein [Mycena maculata]
MPSNEREPLLQSELAGPPAQKESKPIHPYYIVVVSFLAKLCALISTTTLVEVLLQLVCRLYWGDAPSPSVPEDSLKCSHPSVRQYFAILNSLVGIVEGLVGLLMYSPMSRLSGKYGRRSVLIVLTVFLIFATLCLIGAYELPTLFTAPLLLLWLITISVAGLWQFDLMTVMYVVDTISPEQRTSHLSIVLGWGYAAGVPGFALGGALTACTGGNTAVYWAVIGMALILLAYIIFILPESFDKTKRTKLQEEWQLEGSDQDSSLRAFLRPLALLKPHRNPTTGAWNLRLLWCSIHAFTSGIASGYIWTAILVYLALHLGYKPNDNGYILSIAALATGVSLIVIMPLVVESGRGFCGGKTPSPHYNSDSTANSEMQGTTSANSKMDRHLAIFGWLIDIVAVGLLPLARTQIQVSIPLIILGASYFRISTFRSVAVASADPIRSGEILAAIQTVTSLGAVFSGLVLGSVLSASINTFPGLVFLVYSAIATVSVLALCLIRESDRYMAPNEPSA